MVRVTTAAVLLSALALISADLPRRTRQIEIVLPEDSRSISAVTKINAETYNYKYNAEIGTDCTSVVNETEVGTYVDAGLNAVLGYFKVDFGDGVTSCHISLLADYNVTGESSKVEIYVDSPTVWPVTHFDLTDTGDYAHFVTLTKDVTDTAAPYKGVHDVYITVTSDTIESGVICRINWIQFAAATA